MSRSWPITQCVNRADLRERTKTMSRHGNRRGQIAAFRDNFETINWLCLLFKCGIKTKTHFDWLLWHWSSLGQLNLESTQPNGLVGCKVPTDLVKISVKDATHMGFCYKLRIAGLLWGEYTSQWLVDSAHKEANNVEKVSDAAMFHKMSDAALFNKMYYHIRTWYNIGLILGLRPANERRRYFVTTSLIGWAQA